MVHRCSIPGCRTKHKQGLKLLVYPKDPERRWAWISSVIKAGLEPTNNQFICELHFGPNQWEKLRVDGTRKLKWTGVPDIFDTQQLEAVLEHIKATSLRPIRGQPGPDPRNMIPCRYTAGSSDPPRKLIKLEKNVKTGETLHHSYAKPNLEIPVTENAKSSTCDNQEKSIQIIPNACADMPASSHAVPTSSSLQTVAVASSGDAQSTSQKTVMVSEYKLPLSGVGHSITIRIPFSRHRTSLMEDLDDVQSFLHNQERTYEERLVSALKELLEKHRLLDMKLQSNEVVKDENASLRSKIKDLERAFNADKIALKEKYKNHEKVLVENYTLKEKIQRLYAENRFLKSRIIASSNMTDSQAKIKQQSNGICEALGRESSCEANDISSFDGKKFVPLDDQL